MRGVIRVVGSAAVLICTGFVAGWGSSLAAQNPLERPITIALPESSTYQRRADIPFVERGDRVLLMDVFTPSEAGGGGVPAVLFVHGGPLPPSVAAQGKDLGQYQSWGAYLAAGGLAGVVFSNGLSGPAAFQAAARDVAAAVAHVRSNAEILGIDGNRMCMVFVSAGGSLLAPLLADRPTWLKCVVLYYPLLRPQMLEELGAGDVPEAQRVGLDPFPQVRTWDDEPPALFIAEAGQDRPLINEQIRQFRDLAVEAGWRVEYWNHPAGPHGFDVVDDSERSTRIITRTREFLAEQLLGKDH